MTQADMNASRIQELREALWRRPLTAEEQEQIRGWLEAHPEARADWATELALGERLQRLADVPVASNFTRRVLEAVDREATAPITPGRRPFWVRLPLVVRLGATAMVLAALGVLFLHQRNTHLRAELARSVAVASEVAAVPGVEVLADFEVIQRLGESAPMDEELFATLTALTELPEWAPR